MLMKLPMKKKALFIFALPISLILVSTVAYMLSDSHVIEDYVSQYNTEVPEVVSGDSELITLMQDADYEESQFMIKATIQTNYIVEEANVYLYTPATNTFKKILENYDVNANIIDHTFLAAPSDQSYAVVHLRYGPNFFFDRYSEAVCMIPFDQTNLFDSFDCDPLTTAEYLIAATMTGAQPDNLFTADIAREAFHVKKLPRTVTYELYLSVHQMLLAHVAETEGYLIASQPDLYLKTMYELTQEIATTVKKFRRLSIGMLDRSAEKVDKSMVNLTYRIYMTLSGLLDRHASRLTKLAQNNQLIVDFYTGSVPFLLAGSETDVVVSVEYDQDTMSLNYWPWFNGVNVQFSTASDTTFTTYRNLTIPNNATYVDISGKAETGLFPTMRFAITPQKNFESGLMGNQTTQGD